MYRIVLAGLLPVLFAVPGGGQNPPLMTEAEFLSVLDEAHPAVAESSEALALARARVVAVSTLDNPVLGVTREDPAGPAEQLEWALSWQLPDPARRSRIGAREEAAAAAEARLAQQLLGLRLAMREVYADWALASARHELLLAQAERTEALAERERERARWGEVAGLEARRLDLAANGLRSRVALAAAALEQARAKAAAWSPALPPDARPVLPPIPPAPELGQAHPLVRAAQQELAAATLEREAAGRFVRSPELSVGWQRQETGAESAEGPILGLAWSLPVFARNRAEKAMSEAQLSGAGARLERVRREVEAARTAAGGSFERLVSALEGSEAALGETGRMLDGTEAAFRLGEASLTDLLETQRSVTEAELAVLDLWQATLATHRELEWLAGSRAQTADLPDLETPSQESVP